MLFLYPLKQRLLISLFQAAMRNPQTPQNLSITYLYYRQFFKITLLKYIVVAEIQINKKNKTHIPEILILSNSMYIFKCKFNWYLLMQNFSMARLCP